MSELRSTMSIFRVKYAPPLWLVRSRVLRPPWFLAARLCGLLTGHRFDWLPWLIGSTDPKWEYRDGYCRLCRGARRETR